jgi:hypothetical protein
LGKIFETKRNSFGLFRHYFSQRFGFHDPESVASISSLSNIIPSDTPAPASSSHGPYPNKNLFPLGDWYWNHGVQKSQSSFKELLKIVGDPDFHPPDIRSTNWDKINEQLADGVPEECEWLDEDAQWKTSQVAISVPFHRYLPTPGARKYVVANFHHRSLVSVIREKLANENDAPHFHYDLYMLLWQPSDKQDPVHVLGELYTSSVFMDAHNTLQQSPGEPGCELPRIIVALMFWSDSTQLTNFVNAKL